MQASDKVELPAADQAAAAPIEVSTATEAAILNPRRSKVCSNATCTPVVCHIRFACCRQPVDVQAVIRRLHAGVKHENGTGGCVLP